jgi:dynein heavy chain
MFVFPFSSRCFFGDFTDKAEDPADRPYTEIPSVLAALAAVEEALADYNGTSKRPMQLAMFLYALEHVSRISRLMKQPGGHMLLIGVGGSGRQSLAKLAAFMAGVELFQVRCCRSTARACTRCKTSTIWLTSAANPQQACKGRSERSDRHHSG